MSWVIGLLFAFVVALLIAGLFAGTGHRYGAWPSVLWFFVLLWIAVWALAAWWKPVGWYPVWGVSWVPFVAVGIILAALFAAATETGARRWRGSATEAPPDAPQRDAVAVAGIALGVFFWIALAVGVVAIVAAYWT